MLAAMFMAGAFVASPELRAYAANTIGSADIINNSILSADIKDGEVRAADLGTSAVTAVKIKDGEVKSADIGDGTILRKDVSPAFMTFGFKADGQDGWDPFTSSIPSSDRITNVPQAKEGSLVLIMLNQGGIVGDCKVIDVFAGGFDVLCDPLPDNGTFLDYVVINPT